MNVKSVCVYCGSRAGNDNRYMQSAVDMGRVIADNGWRLVYGAGDVGLMGAVARSAQDHGAQTFGVIPEHLLNLEVGKTDLTSFVVTETMHERKKVMVMNADAMVILPGGAGSLDEFFEALTWAQLGLHKKPILVININGFWNPLKALIDHVIAQGFADDNLSDFIHWPASVDEAAEVLSREFS